MRHSGADPMALRRDVDQQTELLRGYSSGSLAMRRTGSDRHYAPRRVVHEHRLQVLRDRVRTGERLMRSARTAMRWKRAMAPTSRPTLRRPSGLLLRERRPSVRRSCRACPSTPRSRPRRSSPISEDGVPTGRTAGERRQVDRARLSSTVRGAVVGAPRTSARGNYICDSRPQWVTELERTRPRECTST